MEGPSEKRVLPESAYRPLKAGEVYTPYVPTEVIIPEFTARAVIIGIILAGVFTLAAAVSGLRAGTVFEAAIPIAILAIGVGKVFKRKNTILENVIIQSVGGASGLVVAGAVFTLPTLYMLGTIYVGEINPPNLLTVFLVSLLGGVLGVVFLIPLRRYFVADQHGLLPFPEATAVNEILVTGEKAGKQASVLMIAMVVGGIFDFLCDGLRLWGSHFTWRAFGGWFQSFTNATKMVFRMESLAFFVGLGYIVGMRYATIIVMGSFMSWMVLVPLFGWVASSFPDSAMVAGNAFIQVKDMTPEVIFRNFVQRIGIGCIAAAGIIGIIKSLPVILASFKIGFKGFSGRKGEAAEQSPRTQRDMNMGLMLALLGAALIVMAVLFYFITGNAVNYTLIGLLVVFIISFLFTTVAANAIAIVGTNPVSGMTLMTLIITSALFLASGLSGPNGMFIALIIGGVVCTALSMAGGFVTDLKVGYWLGATPLQQQRSKLIGTAVSAALVGLAIMLIDSAFKFLIPDPATGQIIANPAMPAPQANLMREVIITFMDPTAIIPWMLFGIGIAIALVMNWVGVPALAFGLGMYLPQEINTPLLLGAFAALLLKKSSKDKALADARYQKGTLIASGFIAGAALFKILEAILRVIPMGAGNVLEAVHGSYQANELTDTYLMGMGTNTASLIGFVFILLLSAWLFWNSLRAKPEEEVAEIKAD
jgi:putative OPT family oligopeptide transporter